MISKKRAKNVLVVLWLAGSAGRKQLTGILNFVKNGHPWTIRLITEPDGLTSEVLRNADHDGTNGHIIPAEQESARELSHSAIPTALIDFPPPMLACCRSRRKILKCACRLQHFYRLPAAPYQKPPGLDAANLLHHAVMTVEKDRINWVRHEKRVNRVAPQNKQPLPRRRLRRADKPASAFGEGARHFRLHSKYFNTLHETSGRSCR